MFKGSFVALVTPFKEARIDKEGIKNLIEYQIQEGSKGIVPCGTTGESATLTFQEHEELIEFVVKTVDKRALVIAGTGSNSTSEAIALTQYAEKVGADAALLITPYYNKPSQEGLYQHYRAVAEKVQIPIILYNVPGRTAVNMLPSTVVRLAEIDNIAAIKEASGSIEQVSEIVRACGEKIAVISGDDMNTLPIMAVGGCGVISVTANIVPRKIADCCRFILERNIDDARQLHQELLPLHEAMFVETNPVPVKIALALMGKISDELRLPLISLSQEKRAALRKVLEGYGLLKIS